jgi:hypothetical protein
MYRITAVDLVFKPMSPNGLAVGAVTAFSGFIGAFDPDDNTTSTGVGFVASMETSSLHSQFETWEETIHPRPSVTLYSNGAFSGYSIPGEAPWIDSDNLSVPHYGYKVGIFQAPVATVALFVRYHLEGQIVV